MVETQLQPRGIHDPRVLEALRRVPREEFVPPDLRGLAYEDGALAIGLGQTISQPFTVAFMCQAAALRGSDRVLEVGTGSGYGAAVLSHLAHEVYSVETIPSLAETARERLQRLGYRRTHVVTGDGSCGLPEFAPYDAIIVTAGGETLPPPFVEQLREGGRIVIPLGPRPGGQTMFRYTLNQGRLEKTDLGSFAFVPLVGAYGWDDEEMD